MNRARLKKAKTSGVSIALALAVGVAMALVVGLSVRAIHPESSSAQTVSKPNIVFILTDDMRKDDLQYMPKTRALLQDRGMSFSNAFVSNALCCPARATIMRGQYSHNTHVWTNDNTSIGGRQAYQQNGDEVDNVATRLDAASYRTALFGKYLNGYSDTTGRPPGWDRWFACVYKCDYYDYKINDDGTLRKYGFTSADYQADVIADHAKTFIDASANSSVPFFAYVAPMAPHPPATPAPRYLHTSYDGLKAPRPPSFNEADVSDKPSWIRQLSKLSSSQISAIDTRHEKRAESLQAVDDLVEGIVGELENTGAISNTYVFFTSDNGWHEGEHRIKSDKRRPYEEDIRMPLLVRGPGVAGGSTSDKLILNTDYLPTFTDLACPSSSPCDPQVTQNWTYVPDGRSLKPVLEGNATPWRNAILLEAAAEYSPAYYGIRTVNSATTTEGKYVEYEGGARELYDLGADPYELTNRYNATAPPSDLASRLKALKSCAGNGCFTAENGP
jgi:N-acetylglucosamine-6-sulfatase